MRFTFHRFAILAVAACWGAICPAAQAAPEDLAALEERAMQAAIERVAPAVVSIETVGGLDPVGNVAAGTGPASGLVVTADGFIVSSAFNFARRPASIIVTLPDGARMPARLVSTDRQRKIVLLKIEPAAPLAVPEPAPTAEIRVGQWALAVGRAFDGAQPNVSAGIVSAVDRVWGKALQTDVKASPSNYGGPLVDIRGRVLGVLVPLSPQEVEDTAGVEWYDSGIGFAVVLEHILSKLPEMQAGRDLHGGLMGVSLKGADMFADPPLIAAVRPKSPAFQAGLKPEDKIVSIDGAPVKRHTQLLHAINRRYAGETVKVGVQRGEEIFERDITLVDRLDPYQRAFLGFLPLHDGTPGATGAAVRFVYPDSPASKAGLQPGDVVTGLNGEAIASREALLEKASLLEPGKKAALEVDRAGLRMAFDLTCGSEPESVPPSLPAAPPLDAPAANTPQPAVGEQILKLPEFKNESSLYVPANYDARVSHALVVWLAAPNDSQAQARMLAWRAHCDHAHVLLLAPRPGAERWQPEDAEFVRKACDKVRETYRVDAQRIVAGGEAIGGAVAAFLAYRHRDLVRGIVAIDAPPSPRPPDNDPVSRLTFFIGSTTGTPGAETAEALVLQLREMKFAVTVAKPSGKHLDARDLPELFRWVDSLDKI